MLTQIKQDLRQYYYDSTFRDLNLDSAYERSRAAIDEAPSFKHMLAIVAQFVDNLKDSHTRFIPPGLALNVRYGWTTKTIGDSCYIDWVRKDSDAEKKGLKRGERLVTWDRMEASRRSMRILSYVYYALSPREFVKLVVESPDGLLREVTVKAEIKRAQSVVDYTTLEARAQLSHQAEATFRANIHTTRSFGDTVMVWRFPSFRYGDRYLGEMFSHARKHRALILDLRGNGGGSLATELDMVSHLFDREVVVGTMVERSGKTKQVAKPVGDPFLGRLIILLDSGSASASEILARTAQLEYRATLVGDRTAGAVVASLYYYHRIGHTKGMDYALQVSVADFVMSDGKRLEGVGVTPDETILPTPEDLVKEQDPVMAHALAMVGIEIDSKKAAKIFRK